MEQDIDPESPDDPAPRAKGSGLFYRDGTEIPPTHPDHGPMHLLPRQEDGRISAYYYCSKAELYDMQVPAPPPRRQRRDGFTLERQEQFLEYVRGGASGREAARMVGISPTTAYNLYNSPDGTAFRAGWDEAARVTDIVLEDTAFDRAVNGHEEIVFHKGERVGTRWKYDNNLLMKLLRARLPLKYAPLSEIEGWLRHRGVGPPADVDGALDRLRTAEAEWGSRLPGEEAPAQLTGEETPARLPGEETPLRLPDRTATAPTVHPELVEGPSCRFDQEVAGASTDPGRTEQVLENVSAASISSTSSGNGQLEGESYASVSSTSSGNVQEARPPDSDPNRPSPDDGSIPYYRPPPRPRLTSL